MQLMNAVGISRFQTREDVNLKGAPYGYRRTGDGSDSSQYLQ
jgi:hypothetical protein